MATYLVKLKLVHADHDDTKVRFCVTFQWSCEKGGNFKLTSKIVQSGPPPEKESHCLIGSEQNKAKIAIFKKQRQQDIFYCA